MTSAQGLWSRVPPGSLPKVQFLKELWPGSRPLFIDIPSLERLAPGEPWVGYRQFCQTCLYPLFLQSYKNLEFQPWLRGRIDGIEPDQCNRLMSPRDLVRPGVFGHDFLHSKLQAMDSDHLAIERLYQSLKAEGNSTILPLVCNLADASPSLGWRGTERKALVDRGRPDLDKQSETASSDGRLAPLCPEQFCRDAADSESVVRQESLFGRPRYHKDRLSCWFR